MALRIIKNYSQGLDTGEFPTLLLKKSRTYAAWINVSIFELWLNVIIPRHPDSRPSKNMKIFPIFLYMSNEIFWSLHRWKNVDIVIFLMFSWGIYGIYNALLYFDTNYLIKKAEEKQSK